MACNEASRDAITVELRRLDSNLGALERHLPKQEKKTVKALLARTGRFQGTAATKESLWEIYAELQRVIQDAGNLEEERKWQMPS